MGTYLEKSTALAPFPKSKAPEAATVNYLLIDFFHPNYNSNLLLILALTVASPTLVEAPKTAETLLF